MVPNNSLAPLFEAAVQAKEEAVVNAPVAAETWSGGMKNAAMPAAGALKVQLATAAVTSRPAPSH